MGNSNQIIKIKTEQEKLINIKYKITKEKALLKQLLKETIIAENGGVDPDAEEIEEEMNGHKKDYFNDRVFPQIDKLTLRNPNSQTGFYNKQLQPIEPLASKRIKLDSEVNEEDEENDEEEGQDQDEGLGLRERLGSIPREMLNPNDIDPDIVDMI